MVGMGYQVLARKYRPQRFADVAGQDHVVVTLMNALTQNRIAHGYIFSGHRGIGKTTIARILACALNCRNAIGSELRPTAEPCEVCDSCLEIRAGNSVDVIEIDAATNRGIDEIRELRDAARYRPSRDRFKIYILDEAHQITDAAFNALLKTLEEPPDHIVFMMATTQPEDIPQTVRSRCQHFSFHAVKLADILGELRGIAEHEGVDADEGALNLLAEAGDGSMRDALSIMDQAIASAPLLDGRARLDAGQIRELMGTVPNAVFERVMQAVDANRSAEVMVVANELLNAGNSPAQLARQAVRYLRSCVIAKISGMTPESGESELLQISPEEQRRAARTAALFTEEELTRFLQTMLRTFDELGYRQEQRFHFELGLLKLVHLRRLLPVEEVLSAMGGGRTVPSNAPARLAPGPVGVPKPAVPVPAAKPAFSPFEQDKNRRKYDGIQGGGSSGANALDSSPAPTSAPAPAVVAQRVAAPVAQMPTPLPVVHTVDQQAPQIEKVRVPEPVVINAVVAEPIEMVPAVAVPSSDSDTGDVAAIKQAVIAALEAAGQGSAADAMSDSVWTVANGEARVQTEMSKTMLPVRMNAEAEKIAKGAMRSFGAIKLLLLPGAARSAADKKPRMAKSGSAQAKAMEHPLVQQAQKLFDAEIQTVIDLSGTD
jgi:DNA polymerase-3 subunit gamma/tau